MKTQTTSQVAIVGYISLIENAQIIIDASFWNPRCRNINCAISK
jgi:hypothetical protein